MKQKQFAYFHLHGFQMQGGILTEVKDDRKFA